MLTMRQRSFLRGKGHHLDPVVQVGKDGMTTGVIGAVKDALLTHELIKVKLGGAVDDDREDVAAQLAQSTGAEVAQVVGHVVLLYKAHPDKPRLVLPK